MSDTVAETHAVPYRLPAQALVDLVDAPELPVALLSPDRRWLLLLDRPTLPDVAELAIPEVRLAGLRLDPRTNGPSRRSPSRALSLLPLPGASGMPGPAPGVTAGLAPTASTPDPRPIDGLPDGARIDDVRWSPDATRFAFTVTGEDGIVLWVAGVDEGTARPVPGLRLNAAFGAPFVWAPDSRSLPCKTVPATRAPAPTPPSVPSGPVVQETGDQPAAAWTFQDLLRSPHDEALLEHYLTAGAVRVHLDGRVEPLGEPGLIWRVDPSPDGRFLLVERLLRPFSYLVPLYRFPARVDVWRADGTPLRTLADLPMAEDVPPVRGAVRTGPRGFHWRADAPATLVWAEAQDGGDPRTPSDLRDRVFLLPAPFDGAPSELAALAFRFGGVSWGDDQLALVEEWWWQTRRRRTWIVPPAAPHTARLLFDRSSEDRYGDPGAPLVRPTPAGRRVLLTSPEGNGLYLSGAGASPDGDFPFLDHLDLTSGSSERLWRCAAPHYEYVVDLLDPHGPRLLTRRESATEPPNYLLRDLTPGSDAPATALTAFPHPAPQLIGVQKELLRYTRADGVPLSGMLYLPAGYQPEQGPLPLLLWAYPFEFKSAAAAGQVRASPHRFDRPNGASPLLLLAAGYAVLDGPAMPIIGEGEAEPNDSYIPQLVADARAAITAAVARGVADPSRVAVGGHSYGAFMTANLLAHSDLFRAGVARLVMLPLESHAYRAREFVLHVLWETVSWLDRYVKAAPSGGAPHPTPQR